MPLHGLDELPNDVKRLIEAQLGARDQRSLALARQFSGPIQKMIDHIKEMLKELEFVRGLRDDFYKQRKALKVQKLEALNKDSKLKKEFESLDKSSRAKLLDSLGDQIDKGQLAKLKEAITGLDKEISELRRVFKEAVASLESLKQLQQLMLDMG